MALKVIVGTFCRNKIKKKKDKNTCFKCAHTEMHFRDLKAFAYQMSALLLLQQCVDKNRCTVKEAVIVVSPPLALCL